jgi:hypothetical protein
MGLQRTQGQEVVWGTRTGGAGPGYLVFSQPWWESGSAGPHTVGAQYIALSFVSCILTQF